MPESRPPYVHPSRSRCRRLIGSVEHRSHKGLNHQAENFHQPTRQRERAMRYFRSPRSAQKFLAEFSRISPDF